MKGPIGFSPESVSVLGICDQHSNIGCPVMHVALKVHPFVDTHLLRGDNILADQPQYIYVINLTFNTRVKAAASSITPVSFFFLWAIQRPIKVMPTAYLARDYFWRWRERYLPLPSLPGRFRVYRSHR